MGVIESQFQWAACGGEQMTADRLRGSECVFISVGKCKQVQSDLMSSMHTDSGVKIGIF